MPRGAILSALLHLAILLLVVFGLPDLFRPEEFQQPIPVQIVSAADISQSPGKPAPPKPDQPPKPAPKPEPKPQPPKPEPPPPPSPKLPPEPAPTAEAPPPPPPPAPAPPQPAPAPVPQPAIAPPPPEPKPEPKPEAQPVAQPKPEPPPQPTPQPPQEAQAEPLPLPPQKPKPPKESKPAQKPPEDSDFASVLKNLEKLKNRQQVAEAPPDPAPAEPDQAPSSPLEAPLSASEIDGVREQVRRCWTTFPGAPVDSLGQIGVRARFNPDGSLAGHPVIIDTSRMSDPFYRSQAEAAVRALERCSPYQMPAKKYSTWKTIDFYFDPKEMGT
jgi:hypothetical protein